MASENPFVFTTENCSVVSEFALENSVLKDTVNDRRFWNRLTIKNGASMDKDLATLAVMNAVYPHDLFPCKYQLDGDDSFFLFRDGFNAIMRLCSRKLYVIDLETNDNIEVSITARYQLFSEHPLDPMTALEEVAKKIVFDGKNVDLRNLRNDPALRDIFCSFKSERFCEYLFNIIIKLAPKPHMMLLSHNQIESLDVLHIMSKQYLAVLDLRHNDITKEGLEKINPNFSIGHLLLDGNPVTQEYNSIVEFAKYVKEKINWVSQLDFLDVRDRDTLIFPYVPTYLRSPACKEFVDHFLHHYFGLLGKSREKIPTMYHTDATFTLSLFKLGSTLPQNNLNFLANAVSEVDHNIIDSRDQSSHYNNVFVGKRRIGEVLKRIPELEFAWTTFTVDVPHHVRDKMIVISVNGLCQAALPKVSNHQNKLYHFARVVILTPSPQNPGEWSIANDMWNICHGLVKNPNAKLSKLPRSTTADFSVIIDPQLRDKTILTRIVKRLTKLKPSWVKKFLDDSDWDLEFTLQTFTDLLKADAIPIDAFEIPEEKLHLFADKIALLKKKQAALGIETSLL